MGKRVVVWTPSNDGPKVWESCDGAMAGELALAYVSGVCSDGSHVAAVFDFGRSIVVMSRESVAQEAA